MNIDDDLLHSFLIERLDKPIKEYLLENSEKYRILKKKFDLMIDENEKLMFFFDAGTKVTLNEIEHQTIIDFLDLKGEIEEIERIAIYLFGLSDSLSFDKTKNTIKKHCI